MEEETFERHMGNIERNSIGIKGVELNIIIGRERPLEFGIGTKLFGIHIHSYMVE